MEKNRSYLKDGPGKDNPFSVPENYFGSFPDRLRERMEKEKVVQLKPAERFWRVVRPQLALAAAIAGFAVIGYLGFHTFVRQDAGMATEEQILGYLDFYHNDFNEYYFADIIDEFPPEEDLFFDDYLQPEDHDAYIDYLYRQDIDLELIISEF